MRAYQPHKQPVSPNEKSRDRGVPACRHCGFVCPGSPRRERSRKATAQASRQGVGTVKAAASAEPTKAVHKVKAMVHKVKAKVHAKPAKHAEQGGFHSFDWRLWCLEENAARQPLFLSTGQRNRGPGTQRPGAAHHFGGRFSMKACTPSSALSSIMLQAMVSLASA